ncbi:hypothetical protein ACJRO7_003689 [Eucalyptus globulus]|uniref:Uncharacterized protein n=1 Tax=Eucalyptus globulus TaxID=34317 RepID=A0ABD3IXX5_EUCGL
MDSYEATRLVFSRIQSLDPDNASKIMGYILLQDQGDKEMTRLALAPDPLLRTLILKAKSHLSLSLSATSSSSTSTTPSSPSSAALNLNPNPISRRPIAHHHSLSIPSPRTTPSYANVVNGVTHNTTPNVPSDPVDDYLLQDHLSFLNDPKSDDLYDPRLEFVPNGDSGLSHRRSYSIPGMRLGTNAASEEPGLSGFGWRPCLYFARGFCKNGASCRFLHGDSGDCTDASAAVNVGSPVKFGELEQFGPELAARSKAVVAQQQRLKLLAGASASSLPYNSCVDLFLQQQNDTQRSIAPELMLRDEVHKFGRIQSERIDFSGLGLGGASSPGSRQIYLTFPADSTFREEDVSNYFSNYGPVQDVRIPYQQKRMFGFVTFVYPETVKLILAKGNPHFVCDSRVLVKPYKEKGKIADRKQQFMDRGEYSACLSPTGFDSRDPFDLPFGSRMGYNAQEMLLRRKLEEQADLHQAIELQGRRLMNLQLLDLKNRYRQYPHNLSTSSPISSPVLPRSPNVQSLNLPPNAINREVARAASVDGSVLMKTESAESESSVFQGVDGAWVEKDCTGKRKEENSVPKEYDYHESLEHILPDNLFASPKKSRSENLTAFSTSLADDENDDRITSLITSSAPTNEPLLTTSSALNIAALKSCLFHVPSFSSGHGAVGM